MSKPDDWRGPQGSKVTYPADSRGAPSGPHPPSGDIGPWCGEILPTCERVVQLDAGAMLALQDGL
jgi:hypothetical protein